MDSQATELRAFVTESFSDDPFLGAFSTPFRSFLGKRSEVATSFDRLAKHLGDGRLTGVVQLSIREGRRTLHRCIVMSPSGSEVADARVDHPDLEVITDSATWAELARGEVAPLEAFGTGRLRVRGDTQLAYRVARKLR